ncbi:putative homogentisate phytyltransferase [Helianthus annuus]|uniref:Homogentisate phytyltransferase n=1 Tax=Helianthus annuus TaxID=4232 RepID=A0A9K3I081_HELAN|nr:putative homogentisate phytyltransferase [Helianthus annuus]
MNYLRIIHQKLSSGTRYSLGTCNVKKSYTTMKFQGKRHNCQMQNDYLRVGMFRSQNATNVVNAACVSNELFPTDRTRASATNLVESAFSGMDILFRFSRPYAAIATVLSVLSTSLLAVESRSDLSSLFFVKVFQAIIGGIFMQIYVCGFNQICDIEIDKINKPYLPLASGELTMNTAIIVTALSAIMSLSIAMISGSRPLFCGLFAWFLVGTAYSANVVSSHTLFHFFNDEQTHPFKIYF